MAESLAARAARQEAARADSLKAEAARSHKSGGDALLGSSGTNAVPLFYAVGRVAAAPRSDRTDRPRMFCGFSASVVVVVPVRGRFDR